MAQGIVGRESELDALETFLRAAGYASAVLVIEGAPGIGKTTVWRAAAERAEALGMRVLACRPVQAEAKLSFASLADLLDSVEPELFATLPEPQRRALAVATLRDEPEGRAPDQRAVATALASLLHRLAAERPVIVAVDDVQWLDAPSAAALAFAARRLGEHRVGLLAARRTQDQPDEDSLDLGDGTTVERLVLGGLSLSSLHHVIRQSLGTVPSRPLLVRIEQVSQGNPFYAVELARSLLEEQTHVTAEPLPLPGSLLELARRRIDELPPRTQEAVLAVALLSVPTRALVSSALGASANAALDRAERSGVLEERNTRLAFTHPLLASAAYAVAPPERTRRLHRRLADAVEDLEQRARHLALAATRPDAEIALVLERAAERADARGAPSAAAELMQLCCDLAPDSDPARRLMLANLKLKTGDATGALAITDDLVATLPAGPDRARALALSASLLHVMGTAPAAAALCEQALDEAGEDPTLLARIHTTLALVSFDDFSRAAAHARAAREILDGLDDPDPALLSQALMAFIEAEHYLGRRIPMDVVERALELERVSPPVHVADRLSAALGAYLKYEDDFEGARFWLEETYRAAVEEGDEGSLPYALSHIPQLEVWTGNFERGEAVAREHLELAVQTGQASQRLQALYNLALAQAHLGREAETRASLSELLTVAEAMEESWSAAGGLAVLGFLELSLGRGADAAVTFERVFALRAEMGVVVDSSRMTPDYAESLVEAGQLERARGLLEPYEEWARGLDRGSALAAGARARGLLLAAEGDIEAALAATEEAVRHYERVPIPLDVARTHLVLGKLRRRRKEKRLAREELEHALASFAELGAVLWVDRAHEELARLGLRAPSGELTETERRIATLAAGGHTNKEVAQLLFLSPKTVEANIARVYRKLGISSRAELGARMAEPTQP